MAHIEPISDPSDLDAVLERSHELPVWLFKHSVTCGISSGARRRFEEWVAAQPAGEAEYVLLEVQRSRPLSNAVADTTGVRHQSPQLLLLRAGKAVWNTSHGAITAAAIEKARGADGD